MTNRLITITIVSGLLVLLGCGGGSSDTPANNTLDTNAMPPVGSNVADTTAVTLMTDWVNSLSCN